MEETNSTFWKIGLFFFVAMVLLLVLTFGTQQVSVLSSTTNLDIYFPSVDGVKPGDTVKVLGVKLGAVQKIDIVSPEDLPEERSNYRVHITVGLEGERSELEKKLDGTYIISVKRSSVLGGNVIAIERSAPEEPGATSINFDGPNYGVERSGGLSAVTDWFAKNKNKLSGMIDSFESAASSFQKVASKIEKGEGTIGKMVTEQELYNRLTSAMEEFRQASKNIKEFTADLKREQGTVRKLIEDDTLYRELTTFSENAREIAEKINQGKGVAGKAVNDEKLAKDVQQLADQSRQIVQKINEGKGTIGKLVNEDDVYRDLKSITSSARQITSQVESGKGTIGRLVQDEEMGKNLETIMEEMKEASKSIREISEKVNRGDGTLGKLVNDDELYSSAKTTLEGLESFAGKAATTKAFLGLETKYYADSEYSISKAYLRVHPKEDKFLQLGVAAIDLDYPDTNLRFKEGVNNQDDDQLLEIDAQLGGKFFDKDLTIRGGLIEGQVGIGMDYDWYISPLGKNIKFTVEGRQPYEDINDEGLDEDVNGFLWRGGISTSFLQYGRIHGGINRIGDNSEYYVGVGFEYEDEDIRDFVSLLGLAQ